MFNLIDQHGEKALMVTGVPFTYTSRETARMGKAALQGLKDNTRIYRIVPA